MRAGIELEQVVMLETTPEGALVRKLTPIEKNEYQLRTGQSMFFATAEEFDEALMALPYEESDE